jgi:hypothetical protein
MVKVPPSNSLSASGRSAMLSLRSFFEWIGAWARRAYKYGWKVQSAWEVGQTGDNSERRVQRSLQLKKFAVDWLGMTETTNAPHTQRACSLHNTYLRYNAHYTPQHGKAHNHSHLLQILPGGHRSGRPMAQRLGDVVPSLLESNPCLPPVCPSSTGSRPRC